MATAATSSDIITTSPADAGCNERPELGPAAIHRHEGEAAKAASSPESARPPADDASGDFPYFEFYPYGYLY